MILDRYRFALNLLWGICTKPDVTLSYESLLNAFHAKNVFKHFVLPLAELLFVVTFLASLIYLEGNVAIVIVKSLFDFLSFVVGYGASCLLVKWLTLRYFIDSMEERNVYILVAVLMSVIFVVNIAQIVFPNLFFVRFFYVYIFYLVWVMSEGVVDIAEENRNKYMCFVSILVIVVPFIIGSLLKQMVPNI